MIYCRISVSSSHSLFGRPKKRRIMQCLGTWSSTRAYQNDKFSILELTVIFDSAFLFRLQTLKGPCLNSILLHSLLPIERIWYLSMTDESRIHHGAMLSCKPPRCIDEAILLHAYARALHVGPLLNHPAICVHKKHSVHESTLRYSVLAKKY